MKLSKKYSEITGKGLFLIAGPCVIENEKMAFLIAEKLKEITQRLGMPFVFKASYDKANRTSLGSFRGPGIKKGLNLMAKIKEKLSLPVLTDVHETKDVVQTAKVVDILQIPAFLCRQTDLIVAAAKTGKIINIKKGQFLSPFEMDNIIQKALSTGNKEIMLTERGFSFGYNNLVVDLKSIAYMRKTGYPVIIDATHAVQRPGGAGNRSGADREYIDTIARGAVAAGATGVFMEVHPNPKKALSDKDSQYALDKVEPVLRKLKEIYDLVNE
ncbi:MAG: 3-deoxy-8-phosphooctulonate synthase [bacterium]